MMPDTQRQEVGRLNWLQCLSFGYRPLVVKNKGNVARDHLSAERTFLAYVRTSLVCVTGGVAIVQLLTVVPPDIPLRLDRFGKIIGSVTEVLGMAIMIIGIVRYFGVQKALLVGQYRMANLVIWTIASVLLALILVVFGLMLGIIFS